MKRLWWICRDMCHTFIWNLAGNIHLKSFYKTFTQWQSRMKRFACRTSHGNPPASGRWSPDDRTMCVTSWDSRKGIGRFPDGSPPDAGRAPAERRPISWQYFGTHRLGHRAMSERTSYDVHPMPIIPYSSSPMPSRCADIGNIGRDIVRPSVDLWPWHYDPHCTLGTIPDWISRNPQGLQTVRRDS